MKKDVILQVPMTAQEKEAFKKLAEDVLGAPLPEFVRFLLRYEMRRREDLELIREERK